MKKLLFVAVVSVFLLVGCSNNSLVGNSCEVDSDCGSGFCLKQLVDDRQEESSLINFTGGMCSDSCLTIGEISGFDICLQYQPTKKFFLFNMCRNDSDCRVDDSYYCFYLGLDVNSIDAPMALDVCLPESAAQSGDKNKHVLPFGVVSKE